MKSGALASEDSSEPWRSKATSAVLLTYSRAVRRVMHFHGLQVFNLFTATGTYDTSGLLFDVTALKILKQQLLNDRSS
jgi:hypothetical protein